MVRSLLILSYLFSASTLISTTKVYRTDYEYNKYTDAFYKLHIESERSFAAEMVCGAEGAAVMVPASHQDIAQFHGMFKKFPDLGNYAWVANDGQTHGSAEEQPIIDLQEHTEAYTPAWQRECDVVTREGQIESISCYGSLPFICKVEAKDAPYNRECNVYGRDYQKAQNVSSCYKIPSVAYTWNQAFAECSAEGAHLVVLNSQAEHDEVKALMNSAPRVHASHASWFYYAGFRAEPTTDGTPRVFKTIFGDTLEEAGYSTWADNEPNNDRQDENCGSLFKNDGKLNDVNCLNRHGYICEKEVV